MAGLTWKAMLAAAADHPEIKKRCDFYQFRAPEEFYEMGDDRCERDNRIDDPARQAEIEAMRKELLEVMRKSGDPFAEAFAHRERRERRELTDEVIGKLKQEYRQQRRK
jgi:hypothetical protein